MLIACVVSSIEIYYRSTCLSRILKGSLSQTMNALKPPYQSSSGFSSSKSKCHSIFASSKRISAYANLENVSLHTGAWREYIPLAQTTSWTYHKRLESFALVISKLGRRISEPSFWNEFLRPGEVGLVAIGGEMVDATPCLW
jgi:hypothetical protein